VCHLCNAEITEIKSDSGNSGSKKCRGGCDGTYGMMWQESEVWQSVLCWFVWQESGFSHHEGVFTFNLLYEDIL
jgi:hypothetical protein